MSDLAKEIDHLDREQLEFLVVLMILHSSEASHTFVTYGVATEVLRFFMGDAWTNENVFGCHREVARQHIEGRRFLKSECLDEPSQASRHAERVTQLAECLYNFQGTDGLDSRLEMLKNDKLEAAFGEMQCARLVAHPDSGLRFIVPSGRKGADYEAEIRAPGGRAMHCEIKTKCEGSELGQKTIWNTLEKARQQLPKGQPGIIFLSIPEAWAGMPKCRDAVEAAVARVFRQSDRLVAVVVVWPEWQTNDDTDVVINRFRDYPNKTSSQYASDVDELLGAMGTLRNRQWLSFPSYVAEQLPILARSALSSG